MGERVTICEVGPRDGRQKAKSIMPTAGQHGAAAGELGYSEAEVAALRSAGVLI